MTCSKIKVISGFRDSPVNMFLPGKSQLIPDSNPIVFGDEISLTIRRLDLIDTITGGNKWYKLYYNLERFKGGGFSELVTFGGAFSNHIAAVATACKQSGIPCTGIIRGEQESLTNITLSRAHGEGMKLIFVSRNDYRRKDDPEFLKQLLLDYNNSYMLPEGGSNLDAIKGCKEILSESDHHYTHIAVACGTGATASGLILSLKSHQHLIGFSVLKDKNNLENTISKNLNHFNSGPSASNWHIEHNFHFGGYAKTTAELLHFTKTFSMANGIPIEPVYTGKLFFGLEALIKSGYFPSRSKILAIHTGGLQYLLAG